MTINRIHKTEQFVQIPNATMRDDRLSFRARGILAMVLTNSDGFDDTFPSTSLWIASKGREGRDAVRKALNELEACGYRKHIKRRNEAGQWTTETHWYDTPQNGTGA